MNRFKLSLPRFLSGLCFMAGAAPAFAATFVCTNHGCTTWLAITQQQLVLTSSDPSQTPVHAALAASSSDAIRHGYHSVYGTHLYLKTPIWHRGGASPFAEMEHLTAYVYKGEPADYVKTCHIFPVKIAVGTYYHTSCPVAK